MIDKVKARVKDMIPEGAAVVAAVSGGSDSMALLSILNEIKDEFGFSLCAAHVNHCLRGDAADGDENFVREKCAAMGVKLYVKRADVASLAAEQGMGLEECGRNVRYEFFNSLGDNIIIATAHNLSDRVETFFFNFARGSVLRGLCSIPEIRGNIVRPIIDCTKDEIFEYCVKNGIEYVTDATNDDVVYTRNRIRHNVVKEFRHINPSFEKSAGRCISAINEDEAFLLSLAYETVEKAKCEGGYSASLLGLSAMPVKKRALINIIESCKGVTPEYKFIDKICVLLKNGGSIQINGGVTVRVRRGVLDFPSACEEIPETELCERLDFGSAVITAEIINREEINNLQNISKSVLEYYIDCDKIHGRAVVRSRIDGDFIALASRKCTKTLKKLFNELAIPPEKRNGVAVFADDDGVFLVEGAGISQSVTVDKNTKKVMIIRIERRDV
ncbi:MAG: tRNA lysidine(34) synthetase TilS [Ruminococcaceae bacterium]|nr:tRNA lysidine(34) synthetase TilS [Oscillospiraceae bacterium]